MPALQPLLLSKWGHAPCAVQAAHDYGYTDLDAPQVGLRHPAFLMRGRLAQEASFWGPCLLLFSCAHCSMPCPNCRGGIMRRPLLPGEAFLSTQGTISTHCALGTPRQVAPPRVYKTHFWQRDCPKGAGKYIYVTRGASRGWGVEVEWLG